jgi:crotonobetainyl-CoA:carnitine CoA-transferase CaiB-like acyl-CoA transferase
MPRLRWNEAAYTQLRLLAARRLTSDEIAAIMGADVGAIWRHAAKLDIPLAGYWRRLESLREQTKRMKALGERKRKCKAFNHTKAELVAIAAAAEVPVTVIHSGRDLSWRPQWFVAEYVAPGRGWGKRYW